MQKNLADVTIEDIDNDLKAIQQEIDSREAIIRENQNMIRTLSNRKLMLMGGLEILQAQAGRTTANNGGSKVGEAEIIYPEGERDVGK